LEIILAAKNNESNRSIAELGVDPKTVRKWISEGSPRPHPRKKMETRCVSKIELKRIATIIGEKDIGVASEVKAYSPRILAGVSLNTLRYVIFRKMKCKVARKPKAPLLSAAQKVNRVAFAVVNEFLDVDDVVWTDESMFYALGPRGVQVIKPGQKPRNLLSHGSPSESTRVGCNLHQRHIISEDPRCECQLGNVL
jgi:hypothetical protein